MIFIKAEILSMQYIDRFKTHIAKTINHNANKDILIEELAINEYNISIKNKYLEDITIVPIPFFTIEDLESVNKIPQGLRPIYRLRVSYWVGTDDLASLCLAERKINVDHFYRHMNKMFKRIPEAEEGGISVGRISDLAVEILFFEGCGFYPGIYVS